MRARETARGEFVKILASEIPKLKITSWWESEAEDRGGGRLYDLQVGLIRLQDTPLDSSRSLSILMSRDPNILRQITPDVPRLPAKEAEPSSIIQKEDESNKYLRDRRGKSLQPQWETVLIDAAAFMYSNEPSGELKQVVEYCQMRIERNIGDPKFRPSYETIEEHIRPLWQAFKRIEGGNYQL